MRTTSSLFILLTTIAASWACEPQATDDPYVTRHRDRTTASLREFASCDSLLARLRENLSDEMRSSLLQLEDQGWYYGPPMADAGATNGGAERSGEQRQEGVDYSGTNNQEAGVDEADFVKTDGFHIYVLSGNKLEIMGVPQFGELVPESSTPIEGYPQEMLFAGDRAVIFSSVNSWDLPEGDALRQHFVREGANGNGWGWQALTKLTVVDLTDRLAPQVVRELYLAGWYQTARKVDSSVRMVAYSWTSYADLVYWPNLPEDYWNHPYDSAERRAIMHEAVRAAIAQNEAIIAAMSLADFVPAIYLRDATGAVSEYPFTSDGCTNFRIADDGTGHGVTSILSLDLLADSFGFEADHLVTNYATVYASTDTLVIAEPAFDWWWYWWSRAQDDESNVHRFDISQPGVTTYTGSARVDGLVGDQFTLSEYQGDLRVATTSGRWNRWWEENPPAPASHVFVLRGEQAPELIGRVDDIAVGERLWSARFIGDKGYLVTFRNIDPLWTVDLQNSHAPQLIAELEVNGVSTYIHPTTDGHLLTIGYGGDSDGLDWTPRISQFDVSDMTAPTLAAAFSLAPPPGDDWNGWSWTEAVYQHKAFQFWAPKALLAVPLSTYRYLNDPTARWGYRYEWSTRLDLIAVNPQGGLELYGSVDQSGLYNREPNCYWYWAGIRRSIFMGDFIYAIGDGGVTAHRLSDLTQVASAPLAGHQASYYCYE